MDTQVVNIHIFGRTLKLSCPINEIDALNLAAKDLDDRLNELRRKTQLMNSDQLIITAALNISYELTKEKLKNGQLDSEFNDRLKTLQKLLENALNFSNQSSL
ncbi:cell division protein ZapA [Orbus wheelerorum]|uniref:cell division protein ZapA n=1 Tax=Orbus wheelerorum TaxID=3074111 RepID=UPI00370D94FF